MIHFHDKQENSTAFAVRRMHIFSKERKKKKDWCQTITDFLQTFKLIEDVISVFKEKSYPGSKGHEVIERVYLCLPEKLLCNTDTHMCI